MTDEKPESISKIEIDDLNDKQTEKVKHDINKRMKEREHITICASIDKIREGIIYSDVIINESCKEQSKEALIKTILESIKNKYVER